jgi:transketolase
VPSLRQLPTEDIALARRTGRIVTIEEHYVVGGLGGAVAEVLGDGCPVRIKRNGIQDVFAESGPNDALVEKYGISASHVAASARQVVS